MRLFTLRLKKILPQSTPQKRRLKTKREYVMPETILERLERAGYDTVCARCGKPLKPGDRVVSRVRRVSCTCKTKRYHKSCWEAMFLDLFFEISEEWL